MALNSDFDDAPIGVASITGKVRSEVTGYVVNRQTP
jgi:hypothetical protein